MKKRSTAISFKVFNMSLYLMVFAQIGFGQTGADGLGAKSSVKKAVSSSNPASQRPRPSTTANNSLKPSPAKGRPLTAKAKATQKYWNQSYFCDLGDADCRIPLYTRILAIDPNDHHALMYRGKYYLDKKDYDAAIEDFTKSLQLKIEGYSYQYRGQSYLRKENYAAAIQDFTRAIQLKSAVDIEDNYYYRGLAYLNMENYAAAVEDYNEYIKLRPRNDGAYNNRGLAHGNLKNYDAAAGDFTQAIEINPRISYYYGNRAVAYRELGKSALGLADMRKMEELENSAKPSNPAPPVPSATGSSDKSISGGVLNGKAVNLVRPEYPAAARAVRASGAVNVQVTIDESGNVTSATAVSGHPLLKAAAEKAAMSSTFSPTAVSGQKVKVTGIVIYNFGN